MLAKKLLQDFYKSDALIDSAVMDTYLHPDVVGEWNSSRIVFDHGHVEHWLNGEKVIQFEAWNDVWKNQKTNGKWKDYPDYGNAKTGGIALQDHGNKVYFKHIQIRPL